MKSTHLWNCRGPKHILRLPKHAPPSTRLCHYGLGYRVFVFRKEHLTQDLLSYQILSIRCSAITCGHSVVQHSRHTQDVLTWHNGKAVPFKHHQPQLTANALLLWVWPVYIPRIKKPHSTCPSVSGLSHWTQHPPGPSMVLQVECFPSKTE